MLEYLLLVAVLWRLDVSFHVPTGMRCWLQQKTSPCWSKTASRTQSSTFTGRWTAFECKREICRCLSKHTESQFFPIKPEPCPPSSRRNILPHVNSSYLKRCEFSRLTDPHCPIFRLKDIVSEAGEDFQDMAVKVNRMIVVFLYWNSLFKFLYGLPPVYMSHKQDVSQYSPQVPRLPSDSHSHS